MKWLFIQTFMLSSASAAAVLPRPSRHPRGLDVVKTVVLSDGQVLDWVRRESQDANFTLPPEPADTARAAKFASRIPQHLRGPAGTVPIPRPGLASYPLKSTTAAELWPQVRLSVSASSGEDNTGQHWYASTSLQTKVTGGGGDISMFEPYLQTRAEFSLVQTAIARDRVETKEYGTITQTIEAGWMYYPPRGPKPMFFVFFNSNGYNGMGDDLAAWNTEYNGWVQVDEEMYPGMSFDHMSVVGGEQHDFGARYYLKDERWWLLAFGKWVGYYPAELFSKGWAKESTLAAHGDRIAFFGEVSNSGRELTTTDMGSGNFPEAGDGKVAYVKNMVYVDADDGRQKKYSGDEGVSDATRYRIKTFFNSGTSWDSYVYLGGPGAGGVVGG